MHRYDSHLVNAPTLNLNWVPTFEYQRTLAVLPYANSRPTKSHAVFGFGVSTQMILQNERKV